MGSDGSGSRIAGVPLGMAFGIVGLLVSVAIVGLIWKSQIETLGRGAGELGADGGRGPNQIIDRTRVTGTIVKMQELKSALEGFRVQSGGYPSDLATARERSGTPSDSWGAQFEYDVSGPIGSGDGMALYKSYTLVSRGPDGLLDTDDDLVMKDGVVTTAGASRDDDDDRGGNRVDAETGGGMVDPGPSSEALPAARRALDAARGVAGRQGSPTGEEGE